MLLDRPYHILEQILQGTLLYMINRMCVCLAEMTRSLPDVGTNGSVMTWMSYAESMSGLCVIMQLSKVLCDKQVVNCTKAPCRARLRILTATGVVIGVHAQMIAEIWHFGLECMMAAHHDQCHLNHAHAC